jgi:hypothetical protein
MIDEEMEKRRDREEGWQMGILRNRNKMSRE